MISRDILPDPDPEASKRLHLVHGRKYRVIKSFIDSDQRSHPVGEEWVFAGSRFSRFEDEFLISIRFASNEIGSFGLICKEDEQYEIVRHFDEYVVQV